MPDDTLDIELLQELLWAYGPCGQEDAVREICRRELEARIEWTWIDPAGNLIGLLRGSSGVDPSPSPIRVLAHMDELSMIVKRVEQDGTLHVTQLGTMYPGNFGLGPVSALGDRADLWRQCSRSGPSTPPRKVSGSGRPSRTG